jgi:hypothetical protein
MRMRIAAAQRDALAHADEALADWPVAVELCSGQALPRVRDVEFEMVIGPAQQHGRLGAVAGVFQRVGE